MSDVIDRLRALDPEPDGRSGAPPLGWLRALLDAEPEPPSRVRRPHRAPGPRRRGPIAVAVALACLIALALVAVAVLGGGKDEDGLVPAHSEQPVVVHVVVDAVEPGPVIQIGEGRNRGRLDGPVERWSDVGGQRWRERTTLSRARGLPGGTIDTAFEKNVERTRESWSRRVRVQRDPGRSGATFGSNIALLNGLSPLAHTDAGRAFIAGVPDPRGAIEAMIARREIRAAGETIRDGRRLLRFTGETAARRTRPGNGFWPATRSTFLLDPDSYVPFEIECRYAFLPQSPRQPPRFTGHTTLRFLVYETLPLSRRTESFLRLGGPTR
ncbi:hypothetical protein Q5424_13620 [Conexibacter sp. JD483]|uniref:hypothetical protein n=1 Tax=unclassified Conexibacter TaxID=2627773 RepID=UPI0027290E5F|nr:MULTISPECIES: hypothetical protein [unclassified Conexibacter]MDO8184595.1 hypothetical protein [Conexibacter sp. CPCC 205706]MDO8197901.1 hypothetical protein [Conexibacter sp. CPCC 205762]MDR9370134.1 hypothetical protein [Conexibacter sp. JD483]